MSTTIQTPQFAQRGVTIREARAADLDVIQTLLFDIFQEPEFNRQDLDHTLWERMEARYQADPQKNRNDFFGPDAGRRYAVVLHDLNNGALVGFAWIIADAREPSLGELNKLYLRKDFRGRGLGKLVLQIMIEQAKALGFTTLYLLTGRELTAAIDMYRRYGFVQVPQQRYQNSPNTLAMERKLTAPTPRPAPKPPRYIFINSRMLAAHSFVGFCFQLIFGTVGYFILMAFAPEKLSPHHNVPGGLTGEFAFDVSARLLMAIAIAGLGQLLWHKSKRGRILAISAVNVLMAFDLLFTLPLY